MPILPSPSNPSNVATGPVLVTGGTGFLGAYIIKALIEKGYTVRAIRRSDKVPFFISPGILQQVEWIEGDILDPFGLEEAMTGAYAVIHAAAKVSFAKEDKKELFQTNIEGTANVVNAAIDSSIKRFVHVSSVASLGRTANGEQVTEDKKWEDSKLNTTYAISKFRGELEVWRAIGEGLPGVVLNPSTILGFGDWNTSSCAIFKSVYNKFPWYSEGVNGFVDVEDVAVAAVLMMESQIVAERFILNGDNWSFHKLFDTIATEFKVNLPTREATPTLGAIAWRMEKLKSVLSGKRPLLTKESARVAQSKTFFDSSLIQQKLPGFTFTPLETTIRNACGLYLATQSMAGARNSATPTH